MLLAKEGVVEIRNRRDRTDQRIARGQLLEALRDLARRSAEGPESRAGTARLAGRPLQEGHRRANLLKKVGAAHFFFWERAGGEPGRWLERVEAAVIPILASHGLDLVDTEWQREGRRWVLRFFVDKAGRHQRRRLPGGQPGSGRRARRHRA